MFRWHLLSLYHLLYLLYHFLRLCQHLRHGISSAAHPIPGRPFSLSARGQAVTSERRLRGVPYTVSIENNFALLHGSVSAACCKERVPAASVRHQRCNDRILSESSQWRQTIPVQSFGKSVDIWSQKVLSRAAAKGFSHIRSTHK